jgi:hypothetical protein
MRQNAAAYERFKSQGERRFEALLPQNHGLGQYSLTL